MRFDLGSRRRHRIVVPASKKRLALAGPKRVAPESDHFQAERANPSERCKSRSVLPRRDARG